MTTGTFNFAPSLGELVINAFARCGIRRTALLAEHMQDARLAANLITADWSSSGVNLWAVDSQTITLVQGTASYSIPVTTIFVLDAYITTSISDIIVFPISRSDYAAIPEKTLQGRPSIFWFDRLLSPSITLWQVPDAGPYTLTYWRARQIQDSELSAAAQPEVPWRALHAFTLRLAAELADMGYAPALVDRLDARAQKAWQTFISSDTENVGIQILPELRGYYR